PPLRERAAAIPLPPIASAADLAPAMDAVLAAVSRGDITTSQAVELSMVVATRLRVVEADEFNRRLSAIEHGDPARWQGSARPPGRTEPLAGAPRGYAPRRAARRRPLLHAGDDHVDGRGR